jgi:hypothetical protein
MAKYLVNNELIWMWKETAGGPAMAWRIARLGAEI